jgi:hypothetical protein
VDYSTSNGTATSSNYTTTNGTLTFADGESEKTFTVEIKDNGNINGNKSFNLSLTNPVNVALGDSEAVVTILDDEVGSFGSGSVKFVKSSFNSPERDEIGIVEISRVGGTLGTVSVDYKTDGGTAVAVQDYEVTTGTMTFAPGESKKYFTIPLVKDSQNDSGEMINLKLLNPVKTVLTSPSAAHLIIE